MYFDSENWATENPSKNRKVFQKSRQLAQKYKKQNFFGSLIYQAVLFGKITIEEPRVGVVNPMMRQKDPAVAIYLILNTTIDEIKKALKKVKNY